jgi:catalase (peroxidase I)
MNRGFMFAKANVPAYLPIDDNHKLARDTRSMAVVSVDKEGLRNYRKRKYAILKDKRLLEEANVQIRLLQAEMADLRSLVHNYIGINTNDGK